MALVALDFSIVSRLIPRGLLQGRSLVRRPVGLARRLLGLFCPLFSSLFAACSRLVNFLVSPVSISSLNILRWVVFGSSMSKKRRPGPDLLADLYST